MIGRQKQFELAQCAAAEEALRGLSDKDKVHFALKLMLGTEDPAAAGALSFAAHRISEHAQILIREAYERECL